MFKRLNNFWQRMVIGTILVIFILGLILLSSHPIVQPFFVLVFALIVGISLWEFYQLAKEKKYEPLQWGGIITALIYCLALYLSIVFPIFYFLPFLVLGASLLCSFCYYFTRGKEPFVNLSITFFGLLYIALPLSCLLLMNYSQADGKYWLIYTLFVTKICDIGAFFTGKVLGKTPLAPIISPKKTMEGAIAGATFAVLTSIFFPHILYFLTGHFIPNITLSAALILGLFIGILGQLGDLAESILKRDAQVKDSNRLPGLGGLLDIVDSLLFTAPLVYFYLTIL